MHRMATLQGFAAVMEGVRNAVPRLKGRAIAGAHDDQQIPALTERSKLRVADFCADFDTRLSEVPFVAGDSFSAAAITTLVTVVSRHGHWTCRFPPSGARWYVTYNSVSARPSKAA